MGTCSDVLSPSVVMAVPGCGVCGVSGTRLPAALAVLLSEPNNPPWATMPRSAASDIELESDRLWKPLLFCVLRRTRL